MLQGTFRPIYLWVDWRISETILRKIQFLSLLLGIFDISPSESGFTQSLASFIYRTSCPVKMKQYFSGCAEASRREKGFSEKNA